MNETKTILQVCGCRGSRPVCGPQYEEFGGQTTCFVFRSGGEAVVVDCGSGLSNAAGLLAGCGRVDVLLTHLHYDHLIGLLDWGVFAQSAPPTFYSTFSDWQCDPLNEFCRPPFWPIGPGEHRIEDVQAGRRLELAGGMWAVFYKSGHPNAGNIIELHTRSSLVALVFDYEHGFPLPASLRGCELLIYDGMFSDETYPPCRGWGHSTWQEACGCARRLGARRLLVTHHAPGSDDGLLRGWERQAKQLLPAAGFARVGQRFEV